MRFPFLQKYKVLFVSLGAASLFATVVYAAGPFAPGTNLDPDCLPNAGGCFVTSPVTPAAGSDTEVQFNNAGAFGSDSNFTFSNNVLSVMGTAAGLDVNHSGGGLDDLTASGTYTGNETEVFLLANGGDTKIDITSRSSGSFDGGETVTGGTSGATGTLVFDGNDAGVAWIYVTGVSGTFVNGETITGGTTGETAVVTGSSVLAADVFAWFENVGGPPSAIGFEEITGGVQTLGLGLSIDFGATTGHTPGTGWTITPSVETVGRIQTHLFVGDAYKFSDGGSHFFTLSSPTLTTNLSLALPNTLGTNGQVLTTDGAGGTSWTTPSGGGGGGGSYIPLSDKGASNGVATLDSNGKIPSSQLSALVINNTYVVASQVAMLALSAHTGDVAVRTDENKTYILSANDPTTLSNWVEVLTPPATVVSVNGQTGNVSLTTTDISEGTRLYFTDARARTSIASYLASLSGYANGKVLTTNGSGTFSWITQSGGGGGGGSPGGSDTDIQFNDSGSFGGNDNFTWNNASKDFFAGDATLAGAYTSLKNSDGTWIASSSPSSNETGIIKIGLSPGGTQGIGTIYSNSLYNSSAGSYSYDTGAIDLVSKMFAKNGSTTYSLSVGTNGQVYSTNEATGQYGFHLNYYADTFELGDTSDTFNHTKLSVDDNMSQVQIQGNRVFTTPSPVFSGTGTDDFSLTGAYSGSGTPDVVVTITGTDNQLLMISGTSGTFTVGDSVTGTSSGSTGLISYVNGSTVVIRLIGPSDFTGDTTLTDTTSGATATINSVQDTDIYSVVVDSVLEYTDIPAIEASSFEIITGVYGSFLSPTGHNQSDYWQYTYGAASFGTMLNLNGQTHEFQIGDVSHLGSKAVFQVQDTGIGSIMAQARDFSLANPDNTTQKYFWANWNGGNPNIILGGNGNNTTFNLNDTAQTVTINAKTTTLNSGIINYERSTSSTTDTITLSDYYVDLNTLTSGAPIAEHLPTASTAAGQTFIISDKGCNASVNPITLTPSGFDTINLQSTQVISNDCESYTIHSDGISNWITSTIASPNWSLTGNAGTTPGTDFIGTTDNVDLVVKVGGSQVGRFYLGGSVALGTSVAPSPNMLAFGADAGVSATNAQGAIMLGYRTGNGAINAGDSFFAGNSAGENAVGATLSQFIGTSAGYSAENAIRSEFIGVAAGINAHNAARSIFIGNFAGETDTVDNTVSGHSILIGDNTSTGTSCSGHGCSNSIALGTGATNTAAKQFMIGSSLFPIDEIKVVQTGGTSCIIDSSGLGCSSDERLKTNITDLSPTSTLDDLLKLRTVTFNWNSDPGANQQIGFIAQDVNQVFPDLVHTDATTGYLSVYYEKMTPVIVEAIRELNMKVVAMTDLTAANNSFVGQLISWLGSATNGITNIFSTKLTTEQICVTDANGQTCLNRSQVDRLLNNQSSGGGSGFSPIITPSPNDTPSDSSGTGEDSSGTTTGGTDQTTGDDTVTPAPDQGSTGADEATPPAPSTDGGGGTDGAPLGN